MSNLLTIKEAADLLGVSTKTIRRWEEAGKIKSLRTRGGHRRFEITELTQGKRSSSEVVTKKNPENNIPVTIGQLYKWKQEKRPIITLTSWDYAIAQVLDESGVDVILVGDSLAMVALGHSTTLPVTLDEMLHHTAAVRRGVKRALVVCDLPFLSYQESLSQAVHSAGRALKEAGANAVKVEGGSPSMIKKVAKLTASGIPVMGHVGLTPQSVNKLGYRQQGKTEQEGQKILSEAIALTQAGAFAIILEHIPSELAAKITAKLPIPTIGIGAGVSCDGQVLVTADLLGLSDHLPPFAKQYVNLKEIIKQAATDFASDVRSKKFPP